MMRFIDIFGACADSVYQALLFPPPREARASPYAGKIGTGDEATTYTESMGYHNEDCACHPMRGIIALPSSVL